MKDALPGPDRSLVEVCDQKGNIEVHKYTMTVSRHIGNDPLV
jgi:hypothetical protein